MIEINKLTSLCFSFFTFNTGLPTRILFCTGIIQISFLKNIYIYTMEYYSAIKKNTFESVLMRWMKLEPIIQSEVSKKEKHQ